MGRKGPRNEAQLAALKIGQHRARTPAQLEALRASREEARQPFPREWRIWYGVIQRCHDESNRAYKWYGARGVLVCEEWRESFEQFLADMGPSDGLQIDRIDNNRGYEPGNCRWTTSRENNNNKRSNVRIEWNGLSMTISEWARHTGLKAATIRRRLRIGKNKDLFSLSNLSSKNGKPVGLSD